MAARTGERNGLCVCLKYRVMFSERGLRVKETSPGQVVAALCV